MISKPKIVRIEDYGALVGAQTIERIQKKARALQNFHVAHVNSTYYGGGVAELLISMTLLMNGLGIRTGWRTITGRPDFFMVTKKMHNALQGAEINLSRRKKEIYEHVVYENSLRMHLDHDLVIIHDPQPLPLIDHYPRKHPWVWRCHIDLSHPNPVLWRYLRPFIRKYDGAIFSIRKYSQKLPIPQHFFMPAIDPFSYKNREMSEKEIRDRLEHYRIPTDLPIIAQISRFDRWKDPEGVIRAYKIARKKRPCTLVLLGNGATDDPEGKEIFESLLGQQEERILILACGDDTALVNALQRKAAVIIQKSLREGFGLTVTEALYKGTPVIGGKVGGIVHQIRDGENGYLVSSVEECADRIVTLLKSGTLREKLGKEARKTVVDHFLQARLLEQYLDLFRSLLLKRSR
ncbi:MAG: glycosyltransferase [Candidatus Omnitrophica bacterium]|nr:glycosyltransferase [Candidatus Omnitrophota bacterium]